MGWLQLAIGESHSTFQEDRRSYVCLRTMLHFSVYAIPVLVAPIIRISCRVDSEEWAVRGQARHDVE